MKMTDETFREQSRGVDRLLRDIVTSKKRVNTAPVHEDIYSDQVVLDTVADGNATLQEWSTMTVLSTLLYLIVVRNLEIRWLTAEENQVIGTLLLTLETMSQRGQLRDAFQFYEVPESLFEELRQLLGISQRDRKSTRLNSSHVAISYAVFCLKKKTQHLE